MDLNERKIKNINKIKFYIIAVLSFLIPFIIYLLTLERKLIGGDTTWYALQIPEMYVMVPTGYPVFSLLGKLFTFLPLGDLAFRLNLFSAVFGGLTILFLFLSINRLVEKNLIGIAASLIFAFLYPFWHVATRLEFDTLNSFFIALVLYAAVLYTQVRNRRFLYLFFFCLGLSLTNHPIALFVVPAIFLFVLISDPKIFKRAKTVLLSILFFILPLFSYSYLLIRSRQGYGVVTDLKKLFYYLTGRDISGEIHGGHFFDKPVSEILRLVWDYIMIIYNSFGPVLIIIALAGLAYLIKKNWKLGMCSILFIIFNIMVPPLYLPFANDNYVIDSMIIVSVFISFGFLLIFNLSMFAFDRSLRGQKLLRADRVIRYFLITSIIITFMLFPISQVSLSYRNLDRSKPSDIYRFWDQVFRTIEDGASLYVHAFSGNVGIFMARYEYDYKNIGFYYTTWPEYTLENAEKDFENGKPVYFVGNHGLFGFAFDYEPAGKYYYIAKYDELLLLNKITESFKKIIAIDHNIEKNEFDFGEKFRIEFTIENSASREIQISSVELELPDNIEFVDVGPEGYIDQGPGMSRGIYMWVSDQYSIEPGGSINIIVGLKGIAPGEGNISFRITTNDVYIRDNDIEVTIK
ncbi:MAG: DUF2723 domain-containing protein [Actinobacteria bacterium]|nr:DUF2723 domain-containing protein [Actinomycetota bacterium]